MKTVLLYQPKTEKGDIKPRSPPLALLSISSLLLKEKYEVKLFDAMIDKNAQKKLLKNLDGAICLGISVWVGYPIKDSLELCEKVRKINPDIPTVWGGWHPSLFPEQTLENPYVDIIIRGQGEVTFLELVKCLETKGSLEKIQGITYKANGEILANPDRPRTPLNDLPPFPYHLIDVEKYITQDLGNRTIGHITSQGCPYNCNFCADAKLYNSRRMELSSDNVIRDLKNLTENYNINGIFFEDTNFFAGKERVKRICKAIIDNKWNIKWAADARANQFITFDDETVKLIKDSGCCLLIVGAESGSQKILDFLNKRITVEQILKVANLCSKFGIGIRFQFMVGLPNETPEDFKKTISLITHLYALNPSNDITFYFYTPYPGTSLYYQVIKEYGFEPPTNLIGWSNFDPITVEMKWVSKAYKEKLNSFLFYLRFAFLNEYFKNKLREKSRFKFLVWPMHELALLRFKTNFFKFPFERKIYTLLKNVLKK